MSIEALTWAWRQNRHIEQPSTRLVLLALADAANEEGICWPKRETLARKTGVSEANISRAVKTLTASGYLIVKRRGKLNVYRLPLCDDLQHEATVTGDETTPDSEKTGDETAHETADMCQSVTNDDGLKVTICNPIGDDLQHHNRTQKEPSITPLQKEGNEGHDTPTRRVASKPERPKVTDWLPPWAANALDTDTLERANLKWHNATLTLGWDDAKALAVWKIDHPRGTLPRGLDNPAGYVLNHLTRQLRQTAPAEVPKTPAELASERLTAQLLADREALAHDRAFKEANPIDPEFFRLMKAGKYDEATALLKDTDPTTETPEAEALNIPAPRTAFGKHEVK